MTKPRDRTELYETAIHEAGHAVASVYTKAVFSRVTIRRRGELDGQVIWAPYAARRMLRNDLPRKTIGQRIIREAIILYAGMMADILYAQKAGREPNQQEICLGGDSDALRFYQVIDLLVQRGFVDDTEEARDRAMEVIIKQTCALLVNHWPSVIALADALMQTTTIGYQRARRIILEATT
jgi:hypothetical protein